MNNSNKRNMLSLSIRKNHLCLVSIEGDQISGATISELEKPFNLENLQHNRDELLKHCAKTIQAMVKEVKMQSKDMSIVLGNDMVLLKRIPVSLALDETMVNEHIRWEAEQFCISPLKAYILEYQKLPFHTPAGNNMYLVVMIKKKVVQTITHLITGLGYHVQSIDVDVFSQIRTLLYNYDVNQEDTVVLIDIDQDEIVFILIREREYFLSHHLSLQIKGDRTAQMDREQIVNVIIKELKRLIFGHRLGQEIGDLNSIYCIGSNRIGDVVEDLAKMVDVKIEMVNPFQKLSILPSVAQSQTLKKYPERMISSLGAFLK